MRRTKFQIIIVFQNVECTEIKFVIHILQLNWHCHERQNAIKPDSCCTPTLEVFHYKYLQNIENEKVYLLYNVLFVCLKENFLNQKSKFYECCQYFFLLPLEVVDWQCHSLDPKQFIKRSVHSPWFCHTRRGCPKACGAPLEQISLDLFQTAVEQGKNKLLNKKYANTLKRKKCYPRVVFFIPPIYNTFITLISGMLLMTK